MCVWRRERESKERARLWPTGASQPMCFHGEREREKLTLTPPNVNSMSLPWLSPIVLLLWNVWAPPKFHWKPSTAINVWNEPKKMHSLHSETRFFQFAKFPDIPPRFHSESIKLPDLALPGICCSKTPLAFQEFHDQQEPWKLWHITHLDPHKLLKHPPTQRRCWCVILDCLGRLLLKRSTLHNIDQISAAHLRKLTASKV